MSSLPTGRTSSADFVRLCGACPVYSEVRLGSEFVTDFAFFDSGSTGPEWSLVEIEAPGKRLFRKSGQPTADLTQAMDQVRDWQGWVHRSLGYAQSLMPHILYPMGYVFIGRKDELSDADRTKLRQLNYENRKTIEVHTLDHLVRGALSAPIASDGGRWYVPMQALKHQDLSRGLPPAAQDYLRAFFAGPHAPYPEEFLEDRDSRLEPPEEAQ